MRSGRPAEPAVPRERRTLKRAQSAHTQRGGGRRPGVGHRHGSDRHGPGRPRRPAVPHGLVRRDLRRRGGGRRPRGRLRARLGDRCRQGRRPAGPGRDAGPRGRPPRPLPAQP
ncbi:hypothetical protein M3765_00130 [Streptomyces thermoviolaceus]|nr:hypothetical protein [Streptomyces thermoviolaceus]